MSVIGNKLQGVYDKLFALLSQFENICVTKFNLLPQQIEKIVAGDNKIASYVDKTIRSITKDFTLKQLSGYQIEEINNYWKKYTSLAKEKEINHSSS